MTRATELSAAIVARLGLINPANGYNTALNGVFELCPVKDTQLPPYALLRWADDQTTDKRLKDAKRGRNYEVEGVFPRAASLADMERFHFDVLRALGWGGGIFERPVPGEITSDSAEIVPAAKGGGFHTITITLETQYVEVYT